MSFGTPLSIANNFDPSVSGLADPVGTIVETVDGTKAWVKWGTGNTQWSPMHTVSGTFGTTKTTWDTTALVANLACDTLGGFRLMFQGTVNATCAIGLRVNGALPAASQYVDFNGYGSTVAQVAAANLSPIYPIVNIGPSGKWHSTIIECIACKSGNNAQLFSIFTTFYNAGVSMCLERHALITLTGLPLAEIQSVGLVASVSGAMDAITTATLVRI
jgi:hypothetical protein